MECPTDPDFTLPIGKAKIERAGTHVTLVAFSIMVGVALKAAETLAGQGIEAEVINLRSLRPLDIETVIASVKKTSRIVTVEEGSMGGFGAFVLQMLAEKGALDRGLKVRTLQLPDIFQDQDSPDKMYAQAGLDAAGIVAGCVSALGVAKTGGVRRA